MRTNQTLFDQSWIKRIRSSAATESWAHHVIQDIDNEGGVYLRVLREWFIRYPFPSEGKKTHMRNLLESSANHDHRGAVNELCWYRFMRDLALNPQVVREGRNKTPDFLCTTTTGLEFYCEVTTLNESDADTKAIQNMGSASLDHNAEMARVLRKATEEKSEQLQFGREEKKATVFVVFDYSTFSGLATQRPVAFASALLGTSAGLQAMKPHLSALVYVERYVSKGKSRIRAQQSALCHNPLADYQIPDEVFSCFWQYSLKSYSSIPPNEMDIVIV